MAHASAEPELSWQGSLLDVGAEPSIDPDMPGLQRFHLDDRSWVELLPSWARGGDTLLSTLLAIAPWEPQKTRVMWDNVVREPRILARWPDLATLPSPVEDMRAALSGRYATDFDLVAVNLYRDGRDSVAWHGDRVRLTHTDPIVCTVSLGHRRRFMLRPRGGGKAALSWALGAGDLVVMGGACQHDWEHCVPKMAYAGARLSITFRHSAQRGHMR
jgi:alkylated DNA repair dioxygenase AlkB